MSNVKLVELDGELVSKAEYCRRLGYNYSSIVNIEHRYNLSFEQAVTRWLKTTYKNKQVALNGELLSRTEYCSKLGCNYTTIEAIMRRHNLTFEEALHKYKTQRKTKSQRLRKIWQGIKNRCFNTNEPAYKWYGERGITVQDSWKDDYFNFEDDLYDSYIKHVEEYGEKDTTLDRIDYNGNYELNNIRWATMKEQANNRRNNFIVVDNLTLAQFSEKYNLPVATVGYRIHHGWTIERIINTPIRKISSKMYAPTGESIKEVAERLGVSESTIKTRLRLGWSWEKIFNTKVKHVKYYYLPCGKTLRSHCICNNYSVSAIMHYIQRYNLSPHEALARYLKNKQKKKD